MNARTCVLVIALFLPILTYAAEPPAPPPDAARGKQLFLSVGCYQCHGTQGAGGGIFGPRLAPEPLAAPAFSALVRHPRARMPAYSAAVLSDAQIADIAAYLRSIPKGKAAADIPMLNH
ncbi:MAG TPA: cytochrome c [Steroidobacteraceae bacterium]